MQRSHETSDAADPGDGARPSRAVDARRVREVLARFRRPDDGLAAAILARTWLVVFAAIALALHIDHPLASLAAVVAIATRQRGLIAITHTASHGVFFRTRRLNTALQALYAYPNLSTLSLYGPDHAIHHREVGGASPTALDYLNYEMDLARGGGLRRTWRVLLRPLLGYDGAVSTWETLVELIQNPRRAWPVALFWLAITAACALAGVLPHLVLYWIVPMVWLRPVLGLWSELADHFGARSGVRDHVGWFQSHVVSVYGLHHALHHRDPRIPCYREARAVAALAAIGVEFETTRTFRDFLRCVYAEPVLRFPRPRASDAPVAERAAAGEG